MAVVDGYDLEVSICKVQLACIIDMVCKLRPFAVDTALRYLVLWMKYDARPTLKT